MNRDIALGMQEHGLEAFAAKVNAAYMSQWRELGLYDETEESWGQAFKQTLAKTLALGGRFHFDLTGLDISVALNGDPDFWVDRYTAWELQQIVRNQDWLDNTLFYLNGRLLTPEGVKALGIELHVD
ncbi:MAG: hypothetical protein EXS16_10240 [Gemmataceae bacterium]|nr:hypothetical protein [Gemmataceae bacterium]